MASIAVQPPTYAQVRRRLYPPVVAEASVRMGGRHDNTHLHAMAVLLDSEGQPLDGVLGGSYSASGCEIDPEGDNRQGRESLMTFPFPNLVLQYPGIFMIRVDIYRMDYSERENTTMIAQAWSEVFYAYDQPVEPQKPCTSHLFPFLGSTRCA